MNPEQIVTTINDPAMSEQSVRDSVACNDTPSQYAIVDVMGHQSFEGRLSEQLFAGVPFVRIDMLNDDLSIRETRLIGAGSIYMITPLSLERMRKRLASRVPAMLADLREAYHDDDEDD